VSGQLVGEVFDAAEAGQLDALSSKAFQALVVIADRAHTVTRQRSVRIGRIAASIRRRTDGRPGSVAASQSTAERAVRELKEGGWVRVVKRGFNNNHGKVHAPIYEVAPFPSSRVTETVVGVLITLDDGNGDRGVSVKPASVPVNSGTVPVTQGDVLDGSIDGSIDGRACVREVAPRPDSDPFRDDLPEDQSEIEQQAAADIDAPPDGVGHRYTTPPPTVGELAIAANLPRPPLHWPDVFPEPVPTRFCDQHPTGTGGKCPPCGDARRAYEAWDDRRHKFNSALAAAKAAWQAVCRQCDEKGWELGDDGLVRDYGMRCLHPRWWEAYWVAAGVLPQRDSGDTARRAS
jgi:hypothetical protein